MKYIITYKEHNEGVKNTLLGLGLAGSMMIGSPMSAKAPRAETTISHDQSDSLSKLKSSISKLSEIRKKQSVKDQELSKILDNIQSNLDGDTAKLHETFKQLSGHLKTKYGYEIKSQDITTLDSDKIRKMNIFMILGWLGSLCLAICGIPQAWQSHKDKHSHGISWGFLLLWAFGEVFAGAYVWDKVDLPLLINYAINILIVSVILYYKRYPRSDDEDKLSDPV